MSLTCAATATTAVAEPQPQYYQTCPKQNPILSDILNFLYLEPFSRKDHATYYSTDEIVQALNHLTWTTEQILSGLQFGAEKGLFLVDVSCDPLDSIMSYALNPDANRVNPTNAKYFLPTSFPSTGSYACGYSSISSRSWPSAKGSYTTDSRCFLSTASGDGGGATQIVTVPGVGTFERTRPDGSFFCRNI